MIHSIVYHTRFSHFLVTLDEVVNHDMDRDLEIPLAKVWEHCGLTDADIVKLQDNLEYPMMWTLSHETDDRAVGERRGIDSAGVYRQDNFLIVASEYDDGSGSHRSALWFQVYNLARS